MRGILISLETFSGQIGEYRCYNCPVAEGGREVEKLKCIASKAFGDGFM